MTGGLVAAHDPGPDRFALWQAAQLTGRAVYRTGGKLGRTIYLQTGPHPAASDLFLGVFDYAAVARHFAAVLNAARPPAAGQSQDPGS